jgi:uncharacterized phage-associated protein
MGAADGYAFTQMHLQELVYIAHGWCLALTGQPLTGDRPEALEHGPEYRRLADALIKWGTRPVTTQIEIPHLTLIGSKLDSVAVDHNFDANERAVMAQVYSECRDRRTSELAVLTRADDAPWATVYAGGTGKGRDVSHKLIRKQFAEIAAKAAG